MGSRRPAAQGTSRRKKRDPESALRAQLDLLTEGKAPEFLKAVEGAFRKLVDSLLDEAYGARGRVG
jgi:hypothetical protein